MEQQATDIPNARPADVPAWRMAYAALVEIGLVAGLRVPTSWLWQAMGLPRVPHREPGESDDRFARRVRTWDLRTFKPQTDSLVAHILEEHGLFLRPVGAGTHRPGEWEVLDAAAAPELAKRAIRDVRRTLTKTRETVLALSTDGLTAQQRSARDDAAAKLATLRAMMGRSK